MLHLVDLLERTLWTAVQAFTASVVATGGIGVNDFKIAGIAAALAVAKSLSIIATTKTGEELATKAK